MRNSVSHGIAVIIVEMIAEDIHSFEVIVAMNSDSCELRASGIFVRFMIVVFVSGSSATAFARSMVLLKVISCFIFKLERSLVALILKFGVVSEHECSRCIANVCLPECW